MNFLLDTDAVAELRKGQAANASLADWARSARGTFFISSITLLELEMTVRHMERQKGSQGATLRAWLDDQVKAAFRGRILAVDVEVALACASLNVAADARGQRDSLLAATAIAHHMVIVTRNVAGFKGVKGLAVVNPFG